MLLIFIYGEAHSWLIRSNVETPSGKIILKNIALATRRNSITIREYFKNATNQNDRSYFYQKKNYCYAFPTQRRSISVPFVFTLEQTSVSVQGYRTGLSYRVIVQGYRTGLSYRVIVEGFLQIMRLQGQLKALKIQLFDGRTGILKTFLSEKILFRSQIPCFNVAF